MKARVAVTLKTGVLDPQGKAIEGALASMGIEGITSVRQGKIFDVELSGGDRQELEAALGRACERLLANTVIENYRIAIDESTVPVAAPVSEPPIEVEPEPEAAPVVAEPAALPAASETPVAIPPPLPTAEPAAASEEGKS